FCTYLFTGWGCLLMVLSWELGWLISNSRVYEMIWVGPVAGIFGSLLLVAALFYVPMAQAHQAATGQARAFFEFRFVWQLVRGRLLPYVGLAALITLAALAMHFVALVSGAEKFEGNTAASAAEGLPHLQGFLLGSSLLLFSLWLLWHYV